MIKKIAKKSIKFFSVPFSRYREKKVEKIITYYPRFKTTAELTDHYTRACWYLPYIPDVLEKVFFFQKIGENVSPGEPPPYMVTPESPPPHLLVKSGKTRFYKTLSRTRVILVWKNYKPLLWKFLAFFGIIGVNVDTHDLASREYGTYCGLIWFKLLNRHQRSAILSENYQRFSRAAYEILDKQYTRSCVFGTGPSLAKAYQFDFSGTLNIVCNSIVQDDRLLDHIKPTFICAGDVVSHMGVSRYAGKFREDLVKALTTPGRDLYFVTTAAFGYLFMLKHPEVMERTILIQQSLAEPNYDLLHGYGLPTLDSTLNIHMLPLASTFSREIFLLGCDGKSSQQDNEDFWAHAREAQYYDLVNTGHLCHPTFDVHRQEKTYTGYIQSLETVITSGEKHHGKTFWTLKPSNIPILQSRQVPPEWGVEINRFPPGPGNPTSAGEGKEVKEAKEEKEELAVRAGFSRVQFNTDGTLFVSGWILSPHPVDRIEIYVDDSTLGTTMLEYGTREDLYNENPQYNDHWIGFRYLGDTEAIAFGWGDGGNGGDGNDGNDRGKHKLEVQFYSRREIVTKIEKTIKRPVPKKAVAATAGTSAETGQPGTDKANYHDNYQEQQFARQESNLINKLLFDLAPLNEEDIDVSLKDDNYFAVGAQSRGAGFLEQLERRYLMPREVLEFLLRDEQHTWTNSIKERIAPGHVPSLREQVLLRLETYKRNREALQRLISLFDIPREALFDVGCQFGFLLLAAAQEGFKKISGAEINKGLARFVDQLKKYIEKNFEIDYSYHFADFTQLELAPQGFNLVTCVDVLEHTPDLAKTMENMQHICRPGGMIYIYQGNARSLAIAASEPHYHLPCISILPTDLAIEVMTFLGYITGKTRYLVKKWPTLPEIRRCMLKEDTHFEVYNTDVNIRNNSQYPDFSQLAEAVSRLRRATEEKLLPRLNGVLKKEVLLYINKYLEDIKRDKKTMPEIDFKKTYLMHSWNIILRPA